MTTTALPHYNIAIPFPKCHSERKFLLAKIEVEESKYNENVDEVKHFVQLGYSKHILNLQKIQQDFLPLSKQVFRTAVLNRLEGKEERISRREC